MKGMVTKLLFLSQLSLAQDLFSEHRSLEGSDKKKEEKP
jgi:hypothetical protein